MTLTVETWIEALESGRYKQAQESLRNDTGGFCCLGVACDLSGQGFWDEDGYYVIADEGERRGVDLPQALQRILGLATDDGAYEPEAMPLELWREIVAAHPMAGKANTLAGLNDYGIPFTLIAKVIRARPKGLFREDAPS